MLKSNKVMDSDSHNDNNENDNDESNPQSRIEMTDSNFSGGVIKDEITDYVLVYNSDKKKDDEDEDGDGHDLHAAPVAPPAARRAPPRPQAPPAREALGHYEHPPLSLLTAPTTVERHQLSEEALMDNARMLEAR